MNNYQSYGSYLDDFCYNRVMEVLEDNEIFPASFYDPDTLTYDERCSLLEAAYCYGHRSFSDLMPAPEREIKLRRWLTHSIKFIESQFEIMREESDRHIWFDSPMIPLCQALYDNQYSEDENDEFHSIYNNDDLFMVMWRAFTCGLAVASGLTSQNINWEDAKLF